MEDYLRWRDERSEPDLWVYDENKPVPIRHVIFKRGRTFQTTLAWKTPMFTERPEAYRPMWYRYDNRDILNVLAWCPITPIDVKSVVKSLGLGKTK